MEENKKRLEIKSTEYGEHLSFESAEELQRWNNEENSKWIWLNGTGRPMIDNVVRSREIFYQQINHWGNQWKQSLQPQQALDQIKIIFTKFSAERGGLFSNSPKAAFIFNLKEKRGDLIAASAYAAILAAPLQIVGNLESSFFEGIIEAFLYKREIDWTASAHQEALISLKNKYGDEIARQDQRFKQLEEANYLLNEGFDTSLKEKAKLLDELHQDQEKNYANLTEQHIKNLSAIERAYDQKLALQKPVRYWQIKEKQHNHLAWVFGGIALVSALGSAAGMGYLAHEYLGKLVPTENPKHWQISLLVIGAFFSIWLVRIFVRLFFSNVHLATDAAERRMIILTYIAMLREGTQFEAEDKKHIIEHIFRSASDGLVKDDAAPPTFLEILTRKP